MQFLIEHGYLLLFVLIFLDQLGFPLPSIPVVLAAGALAGLGEMNLPLVVIITVLACVPADFAWYYLGRIRGGKVLNLLCAISLEPDYCVHRTETSFQRFGASSLVVAKFVPGLTTIAPPMAGLTGMTIPRFLVLNTVGAIIWAGFFACVGFFFSNQLVAIARRFAELGGVAVAALVVLLAAFLAVKFWQRQQFLRTLRMRQLHPREVHDKLKSGETLHVIDLRHRHDFNALPHKVPGALRVPMEDIEKHHEAIPRDRDIVVYCSCPNEASAARVAAKLKRKGIQRVFPMTGGMESWISEGFVTDAGATEEAIA